MHATVMERPVALPLVVEPRSPADRDLARWATSHGALVRSSLGLHGALLFRGFDIADAKSFREAFSALAGVPLPYLERSSPRRSVEEGVFTSTTYPEEREIQLHSEQSYNLSFPRLIAFYCQVSARSGGQTPLSDTRRVLARLRASTLERLRSGYVYVRNFGGHFGLSWREAFQVETVANVETYCRENQIVFEWLDAPGGKLRTRQQRPTIARHPVTGERTWFNHLAFFHPSSLDPDLRALLGGYLRPDEYPHATLHADGSPVEDDTIQAIRDAYRAEECVFDWQAGDLLLVDNMLVAHGRRAYKGERRILVCMADLQSWQSVLERTE
jgi:alpha-ketoglutarate-dependent taurine dioxygenase